MSLASDVVDTLDTFEHGISVSTLTTKDGCRFELHGYGSSRCIFSDSRGQLALLDWYLTP